MTRVRLTDDGPATYRVAGVNFEPGDTHDVSDDLAEHLVEDVGYFEHAEAIDVEFTEVEPDDDSGDLEELTYEELYERAQEADIAGRSEMDSDELRAALSDEEV